MSEKWTTKIAVIFCCVLLASSGALSAERAVAGQPGNEASASALAPILHVTQTVASEGGTGGQEISIQPGDMVTFTAQIMNSGGTAAENVLFLANLPEGLTFNGIFERDGTQSINPNVAVSGRTVICYGLSVPANGSFKEISLSAKVDAPPPAGVTRIKNVVEVFCSEMAPLGGWKGVRSNSVRLIFKAPIITPFPVLNIKNSVTTQDGVSGKKAHVKASDTLTFTMTITNVGDEPGLCTFSTLLPVGLTYVEDSFSIDGKLQTNIIVSGEILAYSSIAVAARGQIGDSVMLVFKAKVDATLPAGVTTLKNSGQLVYMGDPHFEASASSSNKVVLIL